MFNKNCIYRHFKDKLYLPLRKAKSATDGGFNAIYLPLYKAEYQGVYSRPFYGEDGFFTEMPKGRDFYANEKMRFEEVEYENIYLVDKRTDRTYPIDNIELMPNSMILIVTVIVDEITCVEQNYHINIESEDSWNEYSIVEE